MIQARAKGQYVLIAVLALIVGFQAMHQWKSVDAQGKRFIAIRDFSAFYCAGASKNARANPYLATDFISCGGREAGRTPVRDRFDSPAPLPGYEIGLFSLLARLPFVDAAYFWLLLSLIATFAGSIALAKCAELPPAFVALCFSIDALLAVGWGQLTPIALGALCFAAIGAHRRLWTVTGASVVVAAIEPHVGLSAILAAFLFLPRTRPSIAIGIAILGVASLVAIGLHGNIEYFVKVTPLHVMAETAMSNQYSLTWLLHGFGTTAQWAIRLGSISYAVMIAIGLFLARPAARIADSDAAIVLIPVAACVFGGPFIHNNQVALALPALLLLAGRSKRAEIALWIGVICLSVIWWIPQWQASPLTTSRLECLVLAGVIAYVAARRVRPKSAPLIAVCVALGYFVITFAILHAPAYVWYAADAAGPYARQLGKNIVYASGLYGVTVRENASLMAQYSWQIIASKVPFWTAPLLMIAVLVSKSRRDALPESPK